jgi:hypothetical protein
MRAVAWCCTGLCAACFSRQELRPDEPFDVAEGRVIVTRDDAVTFSTDAPLRGRAMGETLVVLPERGDAVEMPLTGVQAITREKYSPGRTVALVASIATVQVIAIVLTTLSVALFQSGSWFPPTRSSPWN